MSDADDLVKNAGRLFQKLGAQLRDTAATASEQLVQTTRQVTGLGRGTVQIEIDTPRVAPGGTVQGRVVLALSEPVAALRLVVALRARQNLLPIAGRGVDASYADVFQLARELDGARRYESQTVAFALPVPADALELRAAAGRSPLADAVRSVASALSTAPGPIEWQVIGRLEVEWGRDLAGEAAVVIAR
jgi:hypothetical protein